MTDKENDELHRAAQLLGAKGGAKNRGRPLSEKKRAAMLANLEKAHVAQRGEK